MDFVINLVISIKKLVRFIINRISIWPIRFDEIQDSVCVYVACHKMEMNIFIEFQ